MILRRQLIEAGLSEAQIKYRLKCGDWEPVSQRAYRVIELVGADHRLRAAMAVLPGAVMSHESAAEHHGIPLVERGRAVVTVHASTTHVFDGVTVHRVRDLVDGDVLTTPDGRVTTAARTLMDLAGVVKPDRLGRIVDQSLAGRLVCLEDLASVFARVARRGKKGTAAMRKILDARCDPEGEEASALERRGLDVIRSAGLPPPVREHPTPWDSTRRFDLAYPEHRLAIEWDSRRWHGRFEDFDRDRRRDRLAAIHGWVVLRFTWDDVDQRPAEVVQQIRVLLRRDSARAG